MKIIDYVSNNARQVLDDTSVRIFPISALKSAGIRELENYLRTELNDRTKIQLKLENPLGVAERIVGNYVKIIEQRKEILIEDEKVEQIIIIR